MYFFKFLFIFFEQSGEASRWRVCYQRGLPRQVFKKNYDFIKCIMNNIPASSFSDWPVTLLNDLIQAPKNE